MAIGNHQLTVSDCHNVSQCYVSRCSSRVTRVISRMSHNIIKMPGTNETLRVMGDFIAIAGMPAGVGCIDCTHITIQKPPGDRSENFRNRKGAFSLNIQARYNTKNCIERAFGVLKRFGCLGKKIQTSLENTKVTLVAAAILHNLAVRQRMPLPDDMPFQSEAEAPDDSNPLPDNHAGAPSCTGQPERRQIIQNYFLALYFSCII
ncbi:uncharacterized protein LOC125037892 [Penaeus chinensis]|uniref:uncharacterized protein LOC125037892 n=1 Tax=Penaeus chinensis TaxID=139456 RepID=UPI001FB6EAEA|nr:uncharacterized protein LOC125037892 [Penaeus chinensis]